MQVRSAETCRMGEIEGVREVELVYVGRLLRMGCDSLLMPVCGSVGGGEPLWEWNGLPWEHSVENQLGGRGRGRDREPNFLFSNFLPPLKHWFDFLEKPNLFYLTATQITHS